MKQRRVCLAIDLGAGSGRVLAGIYDGATLELKEINRFPNDPVKTSTGWHWNLDALMASIREGLVLASKEFGADIVSAGADTWGVDYGLLDADGKLLGTPYQYRDKRTDGMQEEAAGHLSVVATYAKTGIQPLFFNTIFQLLAEARGKAQLFEKAETLLLMPDLIGYFLTGQKAVERSNASTSQLLNASTREWDGELIEAMGLPRGIFGNLVDSGTILGQALPEVLEAMGLTSLPIVAPGTHDTASAVAGIPAKGENAIFLSSGTWSLLGQERKTPIVTEAALKAGFSNEAGVFGTTRFLKNIAGMWLLQECKRWWDQEGQEYSFAELVSGAEEAPAFQAYLNPDATDFQAPDHMPKAIAAYLERSGQSVPQTPFEITRVILESLALKYRQTMELLAEISGEVSNTIHIVGGGSRNDLLNQFAADATRCTVVAGPVEATSVGNILLQLYALGEISSLEEGRALVRASFSPRTFQPEDTAVWEEAYSKFLALPA